MRRLKTLSSMALLWIACSKTPSTPPPPSTTPTPGETITGSERLGWDQRASDAAELATFRYAIYVDGLRSELAGATCGNASTDGTYPCSARFPPMSSGAHTIELASFIVDGATLESARSAALRVTVGVAAPGAEQAAPPPFAPGRVAVGTEHLKLELVADRVDRPTDIAVARDGRVFVAEESGHVRTAGRAADSRIASRVLAIALDPEFDLTHYVYALYTEPGRDGGASFTVARFREAGDTLGDRIVLLDGVRASEPNPSGSLRFGADGKLFVALDAGDDPARAEDLSSLNGKVLRLNRDGTTPFDQAGGSPLYASVYRAPRGFDWDPASGTLWVADGFEGTGRLSAVDPGDPLRKRGVRRAAFPLPNDSPPSSMAMYRGSLLPTFRHSLLVAFRGGRHLLRVRLDPDNPTRAIGMDRLLQDRVGAVRAVAVGPEGAVYFASDSAIGRLVP